MQNNELSKLTQAAKENPTTHNLVKLGKILQKHIICVNNFDPNKYSSTDAFRLYLYVLDRVERRLHRLKIAKSNMLKEAAVRGIELSDNMTQEEMAYRLGYFTFRTIHYKYEFTQ
jgi:hypothetical protein